MNAPLSRPRAHQAQWAFLAASLAFWNPAPAADFTESGLSTRMENPSELEIVSPRVANDAALPDGRVLLEIAADIRNTGDSTWEHTRVSALETVAGATLITPDSISRFTNAVSPGEVVMPETSLFAIAPSDALAQARAELLSGTPILILAEADGEVVVGSATNLVIDSPVILSETPISGGRHLLQFSGGIRNVGEITYSNLTANLDAALGTVGWEVPARTASLAGDLAPFATAPIATPILVTVDPSHADAVRAAVLEGSALTLTASELWVYAHRPRSIDAATDAAWRWPAEHADDDGRLRLVFTNTTPFLASLTPGDLLVQNLAVHTLARHIDNPLDPFDDTTRVLADYVPFLIDEVTVSSNELRVVGRARRLVEVVRSATFVGSPLDAYDRPVRDPYDPDPEKTYTAAEESERRGQAMEIAQENPRDGRLADLRGMVAIPWHFNETLISDKVKISGELLIRQSGLKLEFKIEDFEVERVVARVDAGVVFNLLIECNEAEDTSEDPTEAHSKTLFDIDDIPAVTFNIGGVPITMRPVFKLTAGVDANIPTSLALPLQSHITLGMEMGYDRSLVTETNDGFFYRPVTDFAPIRISNPTVFDDLAATLGLWTQLDVGLEIGAGSGVTLQAGPAVGVRLQSDFTLAPFSDPWWAMDIGLDLIGRFTMDLDLLDLASIQLVDTSESLQRFDLFHRDAGGPLIGGGTRAVSGPDATDAGPRLGAETRWARVFQSRRNFLGFNDAFVIPVADAEGDFIVGGHNSYSMLARFSRRGDLVWIADTYPVIAIQQGAAIPGGGFFTAGWDGARLHLARFESDGARAWETTHQCSPPLSVAAVAARLNDEGAPEYFVAGNINHTTVRDSDPVLMKVNAEGQVVWSRRYSLSQDDEARDLIVTRDGNLLMCGYTEADVAPPATGAPDPENLLKNALAGGLLLKADSHDGEILWTAVCPARWGMTLTRVVEAPDGTIFAAGASSRTVVMDRPCSLFAKFSSDGHLIDHVQVGDDPDWPDELPMGGSSPYDIAHGLTWTPEGLVACGQTGLGEQVSGWVMGLTEELGVRFYSVFDGDDSDPLLDVADVGDGLAVVGHARSPFVLTNQNGQTIPMVLKLPWEGILRFDAPTARRSLYLQPRVYHSSGTDEFKILSTLSFPGAPPLSLATTTGIAPFLPTPFALTPSDSPAPLVPGADVTFIALDARPAPDIETFEDWAAYHRLPESFGPDSDLDGDGLTEVMEAYFGRNPHRAETTPLLTIGPAGAGDAEGVAIQFMRSSHARDWGVVLEESTDLATWSPVGAVSEIISTLSATTEHVSVVLPASGERRFYRVAAAAAETP